MHLLAGEAGNFEEGMAYDIQQSAGDIVILSHAMSELTAINDAYAIFMRDCQQKKQTHPSLRLMNLGFLGHPATIDAYLEQTIMGARLVIVRLLGGKSYWEYGCDELHRLCGEHDIRLVFLSGDKNFDEPLKYLSLADGKLTENIFDYFCAGGRDNFCIMLENLADYLGYQGFQQRKASPLADDGIWREFDAIQSSENSIKGKIVLLFYRALLDSSDVAPIDALCDALVNKGHKGVAYYVNNFRDVAITEKLTSYLQDFQPDLIILATGFTLAKNKTNDAPAIFDGLDIPLLQVALSSIDVDQWREDNFGLPMREIAMNIALTELDGRIFTRMIACKQSLKNDELTECPLARYHILPDRINFVTDLAHRHIALQKISPSHKKLGFVLGNYPASDGRLANGVGLDTPEAVLCLLDEACKNGIDCGVLPENNHALMQDLQAGPTNQNPQRAISEARLTLQDYDKYFKQLPSELQQAIHERWGDAKQDAFIQEGAFHLPIMLLGNVAIGLQPSRGYDLDPDEACHDPSLVPPHGYFAFYIWLREYFGMDCLVHIGKHGTLEWLPGKSLALSAQCYPDAVLGAMPVIYPFICNDPGEGTQAKRRLQAVILDHLPPPIATGGLYDELAELENLLDEYYDARGLDIKRRDFLAQEMVKMAQVMKLEISLDEKILNEKLSAIENFLCDIKFTMIRAGLHRYGELPENKEEFILGLLRQKRGDAPQQQALLQSLADEMPLDIDTFDTNHLSGEINLPTILQSYLPSDHLVVSKRIALDALQNYATALILGDAVLPETPENIMPISHAIINHELPYVRDLLDQSKIGERASFVKAINGKFIAPGASGAPSRGRLEILPTGRNFYSVDMRDIPSHAAWQLGKKSAELLLETHLQSEGTPLKQAVLSMWGTAQMRTGGEDVAQAMALMGVQPKRAQSRVIGYEILPLTMCEHPRVDVTIRISGFFRDAFPNVIKQLSEIFMAVAQLDEGAEDNFLAANYRHDKELFLAKDMDDETASHYACQRIFGAEPGSYGAGLQHLIASGAWENDADFADIFLRWGGFAYNGAQFQGQAMPELFKTRLRHAEAVIHNQDNREHDILDSDDYYQFEGGLAASIRHFSGKQPEIYHNDHSNPDRPKIGTLKQEIARIIHARAANPKWIKAIMKHGYKGAFEIAATVEYLFAFSATAKVVESHQFDRLFDAYVLDEKVREFMDEYNPQALQDMINRFDEAMKRGMWHPERNSTHELLQELLNDDRK